MRSFTFLILSGLAAVASAHFQLQFPEPRGVFNMDNEPTFCDGYDTVASNRTSFPIGSNGLISLNSEHPQWTATVLITNVSNPTSFDNFTQITPFFQESIEGLFCMHFDLSSTNVTSAGGIPLQNGDNVTMQILYNGGDGNLYQCADLTLSDSATTSSISCTNTTSSAFGLSAPSTGSLLGLAGLALALL
ncbi:hypothetical protein BT96DRAFT_912264 [Gymnopus androsaceus JB14]|uniref:Copper acquisition factor BIM1-like domain-containing protein n=1 Tax=Gymnopus androsaceus JB14 TaxID=1447944 RepID=A0A6A4IJN2_9AGAR|nr:hypothetical protein BT96DRAFT_912264 [Gymnopus androsaceus JB14]